MAGNPAFDPEAAPLTELIKYIHDIGGLSWRDFAGAVRDRGYPANLSHTCLQRWVAGAHQPRRSTDVLLRPILLQMIQDYGIDPR
ncbi:MAG: hypothetical protein GF320_15350 [Armatimonadia bacterium]|jgi:hypothetical protein|nr:hypothetical protein [Armatimonadia bacterium]